MILSGLEFAISLFGGIALKIPMKSTFNAFLVFCFLAAGTPTSTYATTNVETKKTQAAENKKDQLLLNDAKKLINEIREKTSSECDKIYNPSSLASDGKTQISGSADTDARSSCRLRMAQKLGDFIDERCEKANFLECNAIEAYRDLLNKQGGMPENVAEERLKDECDSVYQAETEKFRDCAKVDWKTASGCYKADSGEGSGGFMESDGMAMATPMLGMISGANTMLGVYQAMTDRPACYLNTSDFLAREDKLDDQKKDFEEKMRANTEKAEEAQTDYARKLKEWTSEEGKIADALEEIPGKKEEEGRKLDNEKVKLKMQADSKYSAVLDAMNELRAKYNDMVDAKSVALAENSAFTIHDRCVQESVASSNAAQAAKQGSNSRNAAPPSVVQGSLDSLFLVGSVNVKDSRQRYDSCIAREKTKQRTLESKVGRDLSAIKAKLLSYDKALGQIEQEKMLAEQEISYQIGKLAQDADKQTRNLARQYQQIQQDKTNEQALLKQQLERLQKENKQYQEQLTILSMKLSQFQGKKPPRNGEKSVAEMMDQCGADFQKMLHSFQEMCCTRNYRGAGKAICKQTYKNYTIDPPKREKPTNTNNKSDAGK